MPRPTNRDARRAQIVEGLARVMAERGYERASVAAIAAEAGLATGLVHYHFPRKQAILLALVARLTQSILERFEGGGTDPLRAAIDALLNPDGGDPTGAACWAWVGAEARRLPEVGAAYAHALRQIEAGFVAALTEAGAAHPEQGARGLLLAVEGAWRVGYGAPDVLPPGSAATSVHALAEALLR